MRKECVPCPIVECDGQTCWDKFGSTGQRFLLGRLSFIADSQLLRIAIAGAFEGRSDTLTTGASSEITLLSCW